MADDSNAPAPITNEQFARAVAKIAPPPAPVPIASPSFRQRAEEILEQGRPRPPAAEDVDEDHSAPAMLRDVNERIDRILELAHARSQKSSELYSELAPRLPAMLAEKMRLERTIKSQPEPGDADPHGQ